MSETTQTAADASQAAEAAVPAGTADTNPEAGLDGAASFADAETREILNLLGNGSGGSAGGGCCGGSCCA